MEIRYVVIFVIGVLVIGFGYYAISPLFKNVHLDEALPGTLSPQGHEVSTTTSSSSTVGAPVTGTLGHPASGMAFVAEDSGKKYLRYENLQTINGPDIYVYLSKDLDAKEFVSLGKVRATQGNVNYEIPSSVNPREYPYALTWCKQFGVLFNSAKLY